MSIIRVVVAVLRSLVKHISTLALYFGENVCNVVLYATSSLLSLLYYWLVLVY